MILQEMLTNWGMQPTLAESGDMALNELRNGIRRKEPFQLVVTDVNMPEMSGFDFVERLRADQDLTDVQVIVLTSGGRDGDEEIASRLQIAERLMKPVKQSELFDAIVRSLGVTAPEDAASYTDEEDDACSPFGPLRILLAEDNEINRKLAVGVLSKYGHQMTVVNDGEQAVGVWQRQDFDIILMDVQMPVMDGFEATRRIRELEQQTGRHVPIIAMTAHAMKGDREKCIAAGMDEYLPKPIRIEALRKKLALVHHGMPSSPANCETDTEPPHADSSAPHEAVDANPAETHRETGEDSATEVPPIDWHRARSTVGGDDQLLQDLLDAYQGESLGLLDEIREGLDGQNAHLVKLAAHTLKGASISIGAAATANLAKRLEEVAEQDNLEVGRKLIGDLQQALDQVRSEARDHYGQLGDSS
jgi:CheY-like chemotaxis protein